MSELKTLEFSPPKLRYETIADYVNDKGQEFIVKVSSDNKDELNDYIKNLQIDLEYVSENTNIAPSLFSIETGKYVGASENKNIEIVIKAVQSFVVKFKFQDSIDGKGPGDEFVIKKHEHKVLHNVKGKSMIQIEVRRGKVLAEFIANNRQSILSKKIGAGVPSPLQIPSNAVSLSIKGLDPSNDYTISGDITVL